MRILDAHCHVFPDAIAQRGTQAVARFYEKDTPPQIASLSCVLESQRQAGIDLTVLCSAATSPAQVRSINAFMAGCVERSGGRWQAMGTLHPDSEDVEGDIDHLLSLGLLGVKLHPDMQGFALNSPGAMALYEAAKGRLPFLLHTGDRRFSYSNPEQLIPVLKAFPHTRFIGAHMADQIDPMGSRLLLAGKFDNLWVDLSSVCCFFGREWLYRLIRAYGTDRVLFGTDFPMLEPKEEVEIFLSLPLTDRERQQIAWGNGAELLGIAP